MKTISVAEAQKHLVDLVGALEKGPVLLLRKGQPCAALAGLDESFDRETFSLGRNKRLRQLMDNVCRKTKQTGGIRFSKIHAEVHKEPDGKLRRGGGRCFRRQVEGADLMVVARADLAVCGAAPADARYHRKDVDPTTA